MSLLAEAKRRNVFKVGLAYVAMSWLLVQIVTSVEAPLGLPGWFDTMVIVLLAVGFPMALLLAWAFELTPAGIRPTESVPREASITKQTGHKLNRITIGVLALAVMVLLADRLLPEGRPNVLPNSIAVLPFESLSTRQEDEYFAVGLHTEVIDRLRRLRNLNVIESTTMAAYESSPKSDREIADELNVQWLMRVTVQYADGHVAISPRLINPATGLVAWTDSFTGELKEIFAIQGEMAMNVANNLAVAFSAEEQRQIEAIPTQSEEAIRLVTEARFLGTRSSELALEKLALATEVDPGYVDAWLLTAEINYLVWLGSRILDGIGEGWSAHVAAIDKALEIEPDHPDARASLSRILFIEGDLRGAYREYLEARRLAGRPVNAEVPLALGYLRETLPDLNRSLELDPLNRVTVAFLLRTNDALGNDDEVRAIYARGRGLWADLSFGEMDYMTFLLARDEIDAFRRIAASAPDAFSPLPEVMDELRARAAELAVWEQDDTDVPAGPLVLQRYALAYLGYPRLAWRAHDGKEDTTFVDMWKPLFSEVRQLPEFKAYLRSHGYVDVWREYGFPEEFCWALGDDDLECR